MRRIVSIALVATLVACASAPKSDPQIARACSNLRMIHCPEGTGSAAGVPCETVFAKAIELRTLPLECWTLAPDPTSARMCGSLRCVR